MNVYLGWEHVFLAGVVIVAAGVVGAICEYLWLAIHHRRP